jgi:exopolyphosphatase/guanosine-5'-triphosphate,3'-diphosphate pyrophosphatase
MFFDAGGLAVPGTVERLERHITETLERFTWIKVQADEAFVGVGGTVRALARIDREARAYPFALTNGYVLERDRLAAMTARLAELPISERVKAMPGLQADRADIILAGALVVLGALRLAGAKRLVVCGHGLREGLFFKEFLRPRDPPIIRDLRDFSVLNLARLYGYEAGHAEHVAHLALSLFDQLAAQHGYGDQERELLWAASILHDIGTIVDYYDHHKHSAYIILNAGLPGYSHRETALVALLCQYHRKGRPTLDQFHAPREPGDLECVERLSALLRLAEYLDRSRTGNVARLRVAAGGRKVRLRAVARRGADPRVEIWEAQRNADLFETAFACKLEIEPA